LLESIETLKAKIDELPRVKLLNLPTPLEAMPRLTKLLKGPRLWIKRDDCTGLAFGGNKERKTEFVIADALKKKADVVVTTGGIQSNHVRATAAASKKLGLKVVLVVHGNKPREYDGNLFLDYLLGADIKFVSASGNKFDRAVRDIAEELKDKGHNPYIIPGGASYPIGAVAYVNAAMELLEQAEGKGLKLDKVVHCAGSGGTQAGLVLGNKALKTRIEVLGLSDEPTDGWLLNRTLEIANGAARLLGLNITLGKEEVHIIDDYGGEGYGVLTKEISDAIKLVAQTEGILLDPVYTGKAMAGLIDMIKRGRFENRENVAFIHTGGTPALFAYRKGLKPEKSGKTVEA